MKKPKRKLIDCWCCGRKVPVYTRNELNIFGKAVPVQRFKKHSIPKLSGMLGRIYWCPKSNQET